MYCGEITSRYSTPAGRPSALMSQSRPRASLRPLLILNVPVEIRVVDEPFPADRRARLLEIHAHDDLERVAERRAQRPQALRVVHRGLRIVNRARADHDRQSVVLPVQDRVQRAARVRDRARHFLAARQLAQDLRGRAELREAANSQVVCVRRHVVTPVAAARSGGKKKPPGSLAAFLGYLCSQLRPIATLPPPAASETRSTKNRNGCDES